MKCPMCGAMPIIRQALYPIIESPIETSFRSLEDVIKYGESGNNKVIDQSLDGALLLVAPDIDCRVPQVIRYYVMRTE